MDRLVDWGISLTCGALDNQGMKPARLPFRLTTKLKVDTFIVSETFGLYTDLPSRGGLEGHFIEISGMKHYLGGIKDIFKK